MATGARFDAFLSNITVTQGQYRDALTKVDGVSRKLQRHYYPATPYNGSTRLIIGSYGKETNVTPPRDVDILFLMPYEQHARFDAYNGNGQSALLQEIRRILQERYSTTEKIRGDGQVVVVPFQNGHTVELLPAWVTSGNQYLIPNTHDGGSWKVVDHAAEFANIGSSDQRSGGNTRSLIKMMKVWQAECNVPIKSLVLELRSVNFLSGWTYYNKGTTYYDWMVRDFFAELLTKANSWCEIPGITEKCYYGDAWFSRAESAYDRAKKACEYEANQQDLLAAVEWRKIFGDQYGL